uniref:NADH-ubiquinone oxidoreductase chain 4 n=1 Tax=Eukaryota sp. BB2 TaxID=1949062 RepID=A0A1X8VEY1_9EUKA|nr:NADH dehydrogenase subunit 4 [Eukaryota sp. BB2]AQL10456.1 NADH dehydrogenase subunit 4 [Eukaryota sp. BB2]
MTFFSFFYIFFWGSALVALVLFLILGICYWLTFFKEGLIYILFCFISTMSYIACGEISQQQFLKHASLGISLVFFWITILSWVFFDPFQLNFQGLMPCKFFTLHFYLGLDAISLFFVYLTTFLVPLCILFNNNNIYHSFHEYIICLFSLEILLIILFSVLDLWLFYIFFESILIPIFIFIGIWGSRQRKIHAAYLLFFYTLAGSLLMLFSIIIIYSHTGSTDLQLLWGMEISDIREKLIWLSFFFSFAIKIPMFPFHIWLPEAHVESPTEGSVILAGVLLKLGGYGFLRILIPFFFEATLYFVPLIFLLASIGIVYTSFATLRQMDLKKIIAYSSIAHMNIAILGLFALDLISVSGSYIMFFSHGIVSGGLFFMIGILYDRYKTRVIKYYSGVVQLMPLFSTFFLLLILGNISLPGTSSFVGEFLIFCGLLDKSRLAFFSAAIGAILCTIYSIWLYNRLTFGIINYYYPKKLIDLTRLEFNLMLPIVFFMLWLGIYPKPLLDSVVSSLSLLLTQIN